MPDALLLSVRPRYARLLLNGSKTVELRRVAPNVLPGTVVLVYESAPTMALVGTGVIANVQTGAPPSMWNEVAARCGVTRRDYDHYFAGAETAVALHLKGMRKLARAVHLTEIRRRWPWLRPPQSYRYVQVSVVEGVLREVAVPAAASELRPAG